MTELHSLSSAGDVDAGTDPGGAKGRRPPQTYYFPNFFNYSTDSDMTIFQITCVSDNIIHYYTYHYTYVDSGSDGIVILH